MEEQADDMLSLVLLLTRNVTFAAYSLPGDSDMKYIVDDNISPLASARKFIVATWEGGRFEISDRLNVSDHRVQSDSLADSRPQRISTSWHDYEASVNHVISLLNTTEGKVVVSRLKILSDPRLDYSRIVNGIQKMFRAYKNAFRAIYYTPYTGAWCVCSPELLLRIDKQSGELHTVALAGTRRDDIVGDWDDKNIREHTYVSGYIANTLGSIGIKPNIGPRETMATGRIRHILTRISANIGITGNRVPIENIVSALHPTPAICGYPVDWSKGVIKEVESHDRECYGGYIAVDDDEMFLSHVNLRCFAFEPGKCCFWGGGGIMSDSLPETEWNEASLKIDSTLSFIEKELQ